MPVKAIYPFSELVVHDIDIAEIDFQLIQSFSYPDFQLQYKPGGFLS
ncbi:hypothetical protein [Spirosoma endbachense]|nr:hypothetical protein [Spirosoma endbachense]